MKKRGFTLIELLIVTVVIVTLMALVFRLAGSGGNSKAHARTVARLQRLANALSGYYAAFGSYPPVPLQGRSRDIQTKVDGNGNQYDASEKGEAFNKSQIKAACRAQPVAAVCPYRPGGAEDIAIQKLSEFYHPEKIYRAIDAYSRFGENRFVPEWSKNQTFMFGLLSFLLPRYQFMLDGEENIYKNTYPNSPWGSNNRRPYLMDGTRLGSWDDAQRALGAGKYTGQDQDASLMSVRAMLENLPSQAVCARWMPNFAGIVTTIPVQCHTTFFGVDTEDSHHSGAGEWCLISPDGSGKNAIFAQMKKTVLDGWNNEFYYYSPPPYQSYQLWSAGPNGDTFPPWAEKPSGREETINRWIADDIKVGDK